MDLSDSIELDAWPWYAVHCQRLKEWRAAAALETLLGLPVYLPEVRRRYRGQTQHAPLFPSYLFVRANFQIVALSKINATPGVLRVIAFDNRPLAIPAAVIDQIHADVSELNARGGLAAHPFQVGDTVRIKAGPFRGLEAVFQGPMTPSERVRVLIEFLGGLREAEVGVDALERTATVAVPPRQARGTRGKGRAIRQH